MMNLCFRGSFYRIATILRRNGNETIILVMRPIGRICGRFGRLVVESCSVITDTVRVIPEVFSYHRTYE